MMWSATNRVDVQGAFTIDMQITAVEVNGEVDDAIFERPLRRGAGPGATPIVAWGSARRAADRWALAPFPGPERGLRAGGGRVRGAEDRLRRPSHVQVSAPGSRERIEDHAGRRRHLHGDARRRAHRDHRGDARRQRLLHQLEAGPAAHD